MESISAMKAVFAIMIILPQLLLLALLCNANKVENSIVKKIQDNNSGRKILEQNKPNILLILADDVGTSDIPYWGDNIVPMTNIQKLQSKGVTFMDAHASPLCAPSRYMLLSGNYPHRGFLKNGSWNFKAGQNQFINNQKSIAQVLKDQLNYHTGMYGKWHLGGRVPSGGTYSEDKQRPLSCCNIDWNKPMEGGPNDIGFDESFYTMSGIQSAPYSFFRNGHLQTDIDNIKFWQKGTYTVNDNGESIISKAGEGDPNWDSTEYNMRLVKEVDDFLENHDTADPFFLYVGLGQVHAPHSPTKFYTDGTPVAGTFSHPHLDMLYEMDLVVGSMISSIEDRSLMNNTLIIFTSDNGGLVHFGHRDEFGRHFRGGKNEIWEGGHTIPLIMRYDGILPADEKRTGLVGLNDIYATLGDFAGFDIPNGSAQDSISFANHARSEQSASDRKYYGIWIWDKQSQSQAIRYGHYKYVITYTNPKEEYLFNLKNDVKEERNLLREDSWFYNNLKEHLSSKLRQIGVCPLDVEGHFELLAAEPDQGMNVTCEYFIEDDGARCETMILGEIKCNSVCGRFRDSCRLYKDSGENPYYPDRFLSHEPSLSPSPTSSPQPSQSPSSSYLPSFSSKPSMRKSFEPSFLPSLEPSGSSSSEPSSISSSRPSYSPSTTTSQTATDVPSSVPSSIHSAFPTTLSSHKEPPSSSPLPSAIISSRPSSLPSNDNSALPSHDPTESPSTTVSSRPSSLPSNGNSALPSHDPTESPSTTTSSSPSSLPSNSKSALPSHDPTESPSITMSSRPSSLPSNSKSAMPSHDPTESPSTTTSSSPSSLPSNSKSAIPSNNGTLQKSASKSFSFWLSSHLVILTTFILYGT